MYLVICLDEFKERGMFIVASLHREERGRNKLNRLLLAQLKVLDGLLMYTYIHTCSGLPTCRAIGSSEKSQASPNVSSSAA